MDSASSTKMRLNTLTIQGFWNQACRFAPTSATMTPATV